MHHVGVVVRDLDAATAFFVGLGLEAGGKGVVEGGWVDRVVGLEGVRSEMVMLSTPDGHNRLELSRYLAPEDPEPPQAAPSHRHGLRHVAFLVDDLDAALGHVRDHGFTLVGDVQRYEDVYRLCYVRGPEGIIVELAEELGG